MNQKQRRMLTYLIMETTFYQMVGVCFAIAMAVSSSAQWFYENSCLRQLPISGEGLRGELLQRLINRDDVTCIDQLRMDIRSFNLLCALLRNEGKLKGDGLVTIEEQVAMFLHILAHHSKNRVIKFLFKRSGETISMYFNKVLNSVVRVHASLLRAPDPVLEDCLDERWKWFKNCLGALDGTHIEVNVPAIDKPRYRNRKGDISTNVLGVCARDMRFIYVLPGWEGSASDSRILRDAISKRNGLKVRTGYYYLVDAGYANSEGFLAPYRGYRYHRSEWKRGSTPQCKEELFNMRHSMARNVIERTFGLLKMRWQYLEVGLFIHSKSKTT
ncbi:protein ALP1-like isoform X1 [Lotus japonicus]|uniref:protein ALP1-like isoform X1 n=1 Tax=Lotus japonicus TaxID=34305 RepID=UPI00258744C4|nr:protein ALP1-like isoform X1 [Lotus japonicus]